MRSILIYQHIRGALVGAKRRSIFFNTPMCDNLIHRASLLHHACTVSKIIYLSFPFSSSPAHQCCLKKITRGLSFLPSKVTVSMAEQRPSAPPYFTLTVFATHYSNVILEIMSKSTLTLFMFTMQAPCKPPIDTECRRIGRSH